jgi:hypothetical protein
MSGLSAAGEHNFRPALSAGATVSRRASKKQIDAADAARRIE